jgi:uncharacterized protein
MSINEGVGYALTLVMGMTLGLIGAGGSILTVPILVYAFAMTASRATGASLAIVGGVAAIGALLAWQRREVAGQALVLFGIPSVAISFSVRRFLVPMFPASMGGISKDSLILLLFVAVMFGAAWAMIRGREPQVDQKSSPWKWLLGGVAAGLVTGILGAGGGFIIVPILNAAMGLSMRTAVGTSLGLIALNSSAGLVAEAQTNPIDWSVIAPIGLVALVGLGIGVLLQKSVPAKGLKKGFGWMIVVVALTILGREVFSMLS